MNCIVLWCNNKGKIPGIHYFGLTKKRHDAWMSALGRNPIVEHLSEKNVICSKHFSSEDICREGKRIQLRPNAVPKLYLRKCDYIIQQGSSRVLQKMPQNRIIPINDSPQEIAGSMDEMEVYFFDDKENTPGVTISCNAESSPISFTTSSTDSLRSLGITREDTSTDSEGNKGETKMIRREIKIRHNYCASPSKLLRQLKDANVRKTLAQKKLKQIKVKARRLKRRVSSLKQVLWNVKKKNLLSKNGIHVIEKSITGVPLSMNMAADDTDASDRDTEDSSGKSEKISQKSYKCCSKPCKACICKNCFTFYHESCSKSMKNVKTINESVIECCSAQSFSDKSGNGNETNELQEKMENIKLKVEIKYLQVLIEEMRDKNKILNINNSLLLERLQECKKK